MQTNERDIIATFESFEDGDHEGGACINVWREASGIYVVTSDQDDLESRHETRKFALDEAGRRFTKEFG